MKATTAGILLHRISYSETSVIVQFLTPDLGSRTFLFKGGKKKAHALFPMAVSELTYFGRGDNALLTLTATDALVPATYAFDPIRSTVAFFMAEVTRACVHDQVPDRHLFEAVRSAVEELNQGSDVVRLPLRFMLVLAEHLGILPHLEDDDATWFNLDEGTFEGFQNAHHRAISGSAVQLIRNEIRGEHETTASGALRDEALTIMTDYFSIHVPGFGELHSLPVLREILRG